MQKKVSSPATPHEIRGILGPADEMLVMAIRNMGASRDDVCKAVAWLESDDQIGRLSRKPMGACSRRVWEILQEEREKTDGTEH